MASVEYCKWVDMFVMNCMICGVIESICTYLLQNQGVNRNSHVRIAIHIVNFVPQLYEQTGSSTHHWLFNPQHQTIV